MMRLGILYLGIIVVQASDVLAESSRVSAPPRETSRLASSSLARESREYLDAHCDSLPSDHFCADVLGQETLVFLNADADAQAESDAIRARVDEVAGDDVSCANAFKTVSCYANFMPCAKASKEPRKICRSSCHRLLQDYCANAEYPLDVHCDSSLEANSLLFDTFFAEMRTEDAFATSNTYISHEILVECANVFQEEESGISLHAANDTSSEAQCPWPYRTRTYSAVADFAAVQGSNLDGSPASFFAACELPCPDQIVLTDRQDRMLWMAHWVPGLLSLPLNVFIISSGIARRRAAGRIPRKPRYQLDATEMYMACLAVVIAVLDVSIALFLGYDVRCAGHDTVSRFESLGGHPFCKVALLNEHVLQVFVSCLAFALVKLCCQVHAAVTVQSYRPSLFFLTSRTVFVIVIPATLAGATLASQVDPLLVLSSAYRVKQGENPMFGSILPLVSALRYRYSCGPQLRTPAQAHLLIDGPLLASAIVAASAYGWLFMTFRGLIQAIHSGHVKRPGAATQSRALLRLSLATSRFAFVALVCVVMSALSFELYRNVDSLDETPATILAHWETCAASNFQDNANTVSQLANAALPLIPKDSIRFCARVGEAMPRAPLLVAFVLARASPPLVFGVAFAKRALQQTRFRVFPRGLQSVRVAAVRATTSRIATSPTHAARRGAADDRPC